MLFLSEKDASASGSVVNSAACVVCVSKVCFVANEVHLFFTHKSGTQASFRSFTANTNALIMISA